ncbi:TPA: multidrug efflux MFS transporter [Streptococcus suis]|jgi:MFS transporter, DHA1 family, multidrug resistance protein|uniref:multidrug efflux MFS transporter n=1 Tax=Streptococcus parasuis TaxID=1501662 RepID=UPI0015828945|nr:multidrug efflux MFS transporter [Streptococcus parasuis]HEM3616882.1 multidrug efflux MFS transporter [Streptococcus suis]QWV86306.1 multidrug efflux MFS transporter [Streptococcus parasuis]WFB91465.1 multidrug efflux MFS transporter [Streptococcus parasuis]HEM3619238.1 multidrug efflux MFS transporter [Streptococcus suis]HEM3651377.1 multidrug efflux MFS transporter [Streptococcus suis]
MDDSSSYWKQNLKVAWLGNFLTGTSFTLVMPFISVFVEELGVGPGLVEYYAGLAVSTNALAAALMAPIWGSLADRYGRKPMMVRAAFVMIFTMGGMAFVPNVFWLLVLRVLNGVFTGYIPNATALIASQVPKDKTGYALGTLSTGAVAGNLIGPTLGGVLAEMFGVHTVFLLVGLLYAIVVILTVFYIREDFVPIKKSDALPVKEVFAQVKDRKILAGLFVTSMVIIAAAQAVVPILTLYVRHLGQTDNLLFVAGFIISLPGMASLATSGYLGKLGDRIGNHRLLLMALTYSLLINVFCVFAENPFQLGLLRFLYGFGTGALLPSVNSLLTKLTPKEGISRIFAYNQLFNNLGSVVGPMMGSAVAAHMGYDWVFYLSSGLVLFNLIWSLTNFRNYLKVRDI